MAKPTKAQKRKKTVQRVIAIVAVVLVAGLAGTLYVRQRVQRSVTAQSGSNVKSVTVTTGSIKATVSGSGSLTSDNVEDLTVPATVKVEKLYVEQGDTVEAGTLLASTNTSTVLTSLSTVQDALDDLDGQLQEASKDKVSSTCRHQHKCIITTHQIFNNRFLVAFKRVKAEIVFQLFRKIHLFRHIHLFNIYNVYLYR